MADNVVSLVDYREAELERRLESYNEAARLAQRTGLVADGIAAGRRWRLFLDLFMSADQRAQLGAHGDAPK
ncbi:hypothetical protein ACLBXM_20225 [Xanthobacteraceae bacterium A53D]